MPLTESQLIAIKARNKDLLVSAGAGTGKTRVLVERFLDFVMNKEALVTEILALTFTEKAANEMKSRLRERFAEEGLESARRELELAYISTLHAFAARVLREHPLEAGVDPEFRVLQAEEADFLKEQSLEEALDEHCQKGMPVFDLLKTYGEERIRDGVKKVFHAARHSGKTLRAFFEMSPSENTGFNFNPIASFEALGEKELIAEWKQFEAAAKWDWETVESYKGWMAGFSRKRGKKGETFWPDAKLACQKYLAQKLLVFAEPWREKFEAFAVAFEDIYTEKKRDRGFLDFDDLEMKALELFKKNKPVHRKILERYQKRFRQVMVDEFQDTNYMQLELVEVLSSEKNLFFVGDFKQSIYGFRGAEPGLFLDKETTYLESEETAMIPLVENFRTQEAVLSFINQFFENLWAEDNLPFTALVSSPEEKVASQTELLLVNSTKEEPLEVARLREADQVADRILELHEEGASFGDIAILFQAMKDIGLYEQALKKRGIPYYAMSGRGFYYQPEIRDMMSFLSFLENPLSDIPLAATLRSPLFQISDDTLFWISKYAKREQSENPLYGGIQSFEEISEINEDEKVKLREFTRISGELLEVKDHLMLTELLDLILEKTSFELYVLADPQGVRRYANLKKLVNLAREFENYEPMPLGNFLKTVRRLEAQEVRESEAQVEAEQSGKVVRLLSIHRAKGLEFPVVFVADLGRGRQSSDSKMILANSQLGYAMQVCNEVKHDWERPLDWRTIDEERDAKDREEWKRLLYVAMTRAKNHLILSGVHKPKAKPKERFSEMSSWMDWVMASVELFPDLIIRDVNEIPPRKRKRALAEKKDLKELFGDFQPKPIEQILPDVMTRESVVNDCAPIFEAIETHQVEPSRVIDLPVSAYVLFDRSPEAYQRVYEIGYRDAGMEGDKEGILTDDEYSAADFGTCMHRVLERLDFRDPLPRKDLILRESFRSLGEEAEKEASKILDKFLKSSVYKRLKSAKVLKKEIPFILNARHGLIHGVIDLLFQDEKGEWHVLDYKTAVGDAEKLKTSGYTIQIEIYALAVHQLLNVSVSSGVIYFLKNGWEHTETLDAKKLEALEPSIQKLQDDILDYSHSGG